MNKVLLTAALAALSATAAHAQEKKLPEYLKGLSTSVAVNGTRALVTVKIDVAQGWHIWANKPGDENAIPTEVEVKVSGGAKAGKPAYPAGHPYPAGGKIYEGATSIVIPVTLPKPTAKAVLNLTVKAQGCNATSCLPPVNLPLTVTVSPVKK